MRTTFSDEWRKKKPEPEQNPLETNDSGEESLGPKEVPYQPPEIPNGDPELVDLLREAMPKLSDRQREIVTLRYIDRVPCWVVAQRCGIPYAEARKEPSRALKTLYDEIQSLVRGGDKRAIASQ